MILLLNCRMRGQAHQPHWTGCHLWTWTSSHRWISSTIFLRKRLLLDSFLQGRRSASHEPLPGSPTGKREIGENSIRLETYSWSSRTIVLASLIGYPYTTSKAYLNFHAYFSVKIASRHPICACSNSMRFAQGISLLVVMMACTKSFVLDSTDG